MTGATGIARVGAESFERLYGESSDPWDYHTSEYEREKYKRTLTALGSRPYRRVLEVGCSIGVFSKLLAARCDSLTAIDFSGRAVDLARERLRLVAGVEVRQASFPEEAPLGDWDLVICSEVLYYLDRSTFGTALDWLRARLQGGTVVLAVSWRGEGTHEPMRGDETHDLLSLALAPWHALDARQPGYRLDRFDGDASITPLNNNAVSDHLADDTPSNSRR
jgi:SAM-dependent methyltransferase